MVAGWSAPNIFQDAFLARYTVAGRVLTPCESLGGGGKEGAEASYRVGLQLALDCADLFLFPNQLIQASQLLTLL